MADRRAMNIPDVTHKIRGMYGFTNYILRGLLKSAVPALQRGICWDEMQHVAAAAIWEALNENPSLSLFPDLANLARTAVRQFLSDELGWRGNRTIQADSELTATLGEPVGNSSPRESMMASDILTLAYKLLVSDAEDLSLVGRDYSILVAWAHGKTVVEIVKSGLGSKHTVTRSLKRAIHLLRQEFGADVNMPLSFIYLDALSMGSKARAARRRVRKNSPLPKRPGLSHAELQGRDRAKYKRYYEKHKEKKKAASRTKYSERMGLKNQSQASSPRA